MTTEAERFAALTLLLEAVDILWDSYTDTHEDVSDLRYLWLNNTILRVQAIADAWGKELVGS